MKHIRSNAIAYLALFVALGGTGAWAAGQIGSGDIKDDSIKSRDVQNDSLTGEDIDEATLAQAASDGVAQASGRVPLDDGGESGGEKVTILETDTGLVIQGVCDEGAEGPTAQIRVSAALQSSVISTDGADTTNVQAVPTVLEVSSPTPDQEQATFSVVETNGRAVQGIAYASVGAQGRDCVFSVSVLEALG